jgi:LacI family transcriptional regulator
VAATTKDVARIARVSVATVSRYLNGRTVSDENRRRIEEAIVQLGFRANPIARTLRTSRSMTVAVVVPALANIFSMNIIESVERYLDEYDYSVIVCDSRNDPERERCKLEFVKDKRVDGVIVMPAGPSGRHIAEALGDIPVVLIDRLVDDIRTDAVVVDNTNAAYHAVEQLIIRGHRQIAVIAGPQQVYTARERMEGYRRVMTDYGLSPAENMVLYGDYQVESGYRLMKRLATQSPRLSAVFVSNYEMTIGAVTCLNELGIEIPHELSVIGFDSLELSSVVRPTLTVVVQPSDEIGRMAAKTLLQRMNGDKTGFPVLVRLKTQFVSGSSIADCQLE